MPEGAAAGHGTEQPAPHGEGHGGGHGFDFVVALQHHNLPYPAFEPIHGHPILIFNLGTYAVKNLEVLTTDPAFAKAPSPDAATLAWAKDVAETGQDATVIAKAMTVASGKSLCGALPQSMAWLNQQTFFGTLALLIMGLGLWLVGRRRKDAEDVKPKGRWQHIYESLILFVRDDVVRPNLHHGAERWTPHFAAIFLSILAMNLMGLIPGTGTATGNIAVTAALALTTLASMLFFGMKEQGVIGYWIGLVPVHWSKKPADMAVWFLLLGIELLGLIIKPTALAIRLFANMFAGHTVLLAFCTLGLVIIGAKPTMTGLSLGMGFFGWVMAVLIYFLEILVAFIQAYVFTMLSAVFIGSSMHPEH